MSEDNQVFTKQYEDVFDQIQEQMHDNQNSLADNIDQFHAKCLERLADS